MRRIEIAAGVIAAMITVSGAMTAMAANADSGVVSCEAPNTQIAGKVSMLGGASMPSPIVDYDTLEEAEKAVGFRFQVPATITGYEDISYSVISGELIQVIYRGEAGEICIRKALGTEEISGDYNVYKDTQVVTVRKMDVMIEGDGETAALATWSDGKYAYSVGIYDESGLARTQHGMSISDMKNLVFVVR